MKIRDNKGSITMFVLVGVLFMSGFLLLSFGSNVNKSKIAQEQLEIINDIYSNNEGDSNAYNRAYEAIRMKNKKTITKNTISSKTLELTETFEEKLVNYKIYGNLSVLGTYDSSLGKYVIEIKVFNSSGKSKSYSIYLSSPLKKSGMLADYIDYKNQKVIRKVDSQTEEDITLPDILMYEDYTKIQVTSGVPSKIEVEYTGYTLP